MSSLLASPGAAVVWEFRRRHRWGLLAIVVYLAAIAAVKLVVVTRGLTIHLDSEESFGFVVAAPMSAMFTYFLAVFTFGLDGDIAARQSMFPPRRLTQPLTTAALVGWPMLYGSAAMMLLWLAIRLFGLWPSEFAADIPIVWPAFLAASLLMWTQALTWMPYPLPGLRIVVSILALWTLDALVFYWVYRKPGELLMLAVVVPQLPLAYVVARHAVARARRGDTPDWRAPIAQSLGVSSVATRRRDAFPSAASAQMWLEWRRHGRSLPAWVALLLPFELLILWAAGTSASLVFTIVIGALVTPIFIATFSAAAVGDDSRSGSDAFGMAPFIATRPLTNAQIIAAKLKTTIWSTAAAWLLVLLVVPLALQLSGTMPVFAERMRAFGDAVGAPRAVAFSVLVVAGCVASTWKQLVQSLYIGLTGREALIKGSVFVTLTLLFLVGPVAQWIVDTHRLGALWSSLPMILAVLVCFKLGAAVWIAVHLWRARLVRDNTLVGGAALWCVTVLALHTMLIWLWDTPHLPNYLLLLVAILAVPLARLSAAPLALEVNRHR